MSKPPSTTPHSDTNGVHRDERPNTDVAAEIGQDPADLAEAQDKAVGRPPYADEPASGDDRTN
ncbi:MAG TPA: hypothetical protein VGW34_13945 [Allosphingosinicella sp.]|nr:hypothetical protein [Allosphingosinicella sp.]